MNNSQFWAKRIDEIAKIQFDKADEAEKELIKAYQRADKYIQERINLYYVRYAKENEISFAESKKILSAAELNNFRMTLEEFIEKAKNNQDDKWTKELNEEYLRSRISRYDALRYEINNKVKELKHEQLNITKSHLKDAYSDTYYRTAYELEKGTEIGVNFAKLNDRAIENAVYTKWLDNKNFAGRMDDDKINLISNLNKIITQGMITGSSSTDMVNKLIKTTKVSRNRAANLIQTETTFVIGQANTNMYKEFGVTQYEVLETLDSITCETCAAMDGKRFKVSEKQEGLNAPPFHPRCRGTTIPVSKYEHIWGNGDRIGRDEEGKIYYQTDARKMSYEEYMKNKINNIHKNKEYLDIPNSIKDLKPNIKIDKDAEKFLDKHLKEKDYMINSNETAPFRYKDSIDKVVINPQHSQFENYDMIESLVHETIHKLDMENGISINLAKEINMALEDSRELLIQLGVPENLEDNMSVGDLYSCITNNMFETSYSHSNEYWDGLGNTEREMLANLGTIHISKNKDALEWLKSIKPLNELLERILEEYGDLF